MNKKVLYAALLSVVLGVAGFYYHRYHVPPTIALAGMELTDLSGQPVSMQTYAGQPMLVDFFATWCGPCIHSLPMLGSLHTTAPNVSVICISDEPIERLRPIQARYPTELQILHSAKPLSKIGIYTYPTYYIFDRQGNRVYEKVKSAFSNAEELQALVKSYVE